MKEITIRLMTMLAFLLGLSAPVQAGILQDNLTDCGHKWLYFNDFVTAPNLDEFAEYGFFLVKNSPDVRYQFDGEFPLDRHISFASYAAGTPRDPDAQISLYQHLLDADLEMEPGSVNPYQVGNPVYSTNNQYQINVVPHQYVVSGKPELKNTLALPPLPDDPDAATLKSSEYTAVFVRFYGPYRFENERKRDLPAVRVFDTHTGEELGCSGIESRIPANLARTFFSVRSEYDSLRSKKDLVFAYYKGASLFANPYSDYLSITFDRTMEVSRDVYVLKFVPPKFFRPGTRLENKLYDEDNDMRYWSFCLGKYCLKDEDVVPRTYDWDSEEPVYIVFGPKSVEDKARRRGFSYVEYDPTFENSINNTVFMRYMVAKDGWKDEGFSFPQAFDENNKLAEPAKAIATEETMGVFAPVGLSCSPREFLVDMCGIKRERPKARCRSIAELNNEGVTTEEGDRITLANWTPRFCGFR